MDFVTEAVKHIREYSVFTRVRVPVSYVEEFERKLTGKGLSFKELEGSADELLYYVQASKDDVARCCGQGRVRFVSSAAESAKRKRQHQRHYYKKANEKTANPLKQVRETEKE